MHSLKKSPLEPSMKVTLPAILFATIPALTMTSVAIVVSLFNLHPWIQGLCIAVWYILFALFHAFKNGAFEKLHYFFEHGHAQVWKNNHQNEIQFLQILLVNAVVAVSLCGIINPYFAVNPFGKIGFAIPLGASILIMLFVAYKQSRERNKTRSYLINEALMFITGLLTAIFLLTECYLTAGTVGILIPSILMIVFVASVNSTGIIPIEDKDKLDRLVTEIVLISIIPIVSLVWQYFHNKIFWSAIVAPIVALVILAMLWKAQFNEKRRNKISDRKTERA